MAESHLESPVVITPEDQEVFDKFSGAQWGINESGLWDSPSHIH